MPRLLHYSDIENVFDVPERAARLAGRIRALDGPDAAVVATGDTTAPGVLSLVARGRQAIDSTRPPTRFSTRSATTSSTTVPTRSAGSSPTRRSSSSPRTSAARRRSLRPRGGVVPWTTRVVDGATVGFVGVTDPATDSLNPMAAPLSFDDPVAAAREACAVVASGEPAVDHLVVLSHLGGGDDDLARELDVDAILGGHVHSRRNDRVDGTLLVRPE
jgi:5''-nucleotidase/2'',3''-cyclic phosphodiesterase and related esterases